jgi:hypothetical protein
LKQLSKNQILTTVMILFASGLVFYAVGIATNLFASPVFSMFYVISYNTAHTIVVDASVAAAAVIAIIAFVFLTKKKQGREPLKQPSNSKILWTAGILLASGLVFYAIGIATNLFASPIFSMFYIISYNTAHTIVIYAAVAAAAVIVTIASWSRMKKTRFGATCAGLGNSVQARFPKQDSAPESSTPVKTCKEQNSPQSKGPTIVKTFAMAGQPTVQQLAKGNSQSFREPPAAKEPTAAPEVVKKSSNGKIICPNCNKEFIAPMLMFDYKGSKAKLVGYCPYCETPLPQYQAN